MCSQFKVHSGTVWSYFSSLHFVAEIARDTGIKPWPVQFQECLLQIAGEEKQRHQSTFITDSAPCSEVSYSYLLHLCTEVKLKPALLSESSEAGPHRSTTCCFELPKHLDSQQPAFPQPATWTEKHKQLALGTRAGEDIPGFQVHSSAAAEMNSL